MGLRNAHSEKAHTSVQHIWTFIPFPSKLAFECSRPQSCFSVWATKFKSPDFMPMCMFSERLRKSIIQPQFEPLSLMRPSLRSTPSVNDLFGKQEKTSTRIVFVNCCINHYFCGTVSIYFNQSQGTISDFLA